MTPGLFKCFDTHANEESYICPKSGTDLRNITDSRVTKNAKRNMMKMIVYRCSILKSLFSLRTLFLLPFYLSTDDLTVAIIPKFNNELEKD